MAQTPRWKENKEKIEQLQEQVEVLSEIVSEIIELHMKHFDSGFMLKRSHWLAKLRELEAKDG